MKTNIGFGISIELHDKDLIPKEFIGLAINNELFNEERLL